MSNQGPNWQQLEPVGDKRGERKKPVGAGQRSSKTTNVAYFALGDVRTVLITYRKHVTAHVYT